MHDYEVIWGDRLNRYEQLYMLGTVQTWLIDAPDTKNKSTDQLKQNKYQLMVLERGTLIAHAALSQLGDMSWELSSVIVHESYRGKGVGSFLIKQMIGFFDEYGEPTFEQLVVVCPEHLADFYMEYGFKPDYINLLDETAHNRRIQAINEEKQFLVRSSV